MVLLIPGNANPTMADIDAYLLQNHTHTHTGEPPLHTIKRVVREIQSKSGAGARLHPAEECFMERTM